MVRALLALAVLPAALSAQLRILCSSPTMEYCASWWAYDYTVEIVGTGSMHRLSATVELFGSGYTAGSRGFFAYSDMPGWASSMSMGVLDYDGGLAIVPGFYETFDAGGNPFSETPAEYLARYTPSVADINFVQFSLGSDQTCGVRAGTCYEVPEPGSLLLLATGIGGVVIVARRKARRSELHGTVHHDAGSTR